MAISSLGAGSGLDLNGILTQLMTVEQQPLVALQKKEVSYQARLSALGTLKGAVSAVQIAAQAFVPAGSLQNAAAKFASYRASLADSSVASATASAGAVAGSYSLEVTTLAQQQRLATLPNSADVTAGLTAGGPLRIQFGQYKAAADPDPASFTPTAAQELNVTIAPNSTLEQVRDAINAKATDGRVTATIITGTSGKQLVLSSSKTGNDNVMKLSGVTGFSFDPLGVEETHLSQDTADGGQAAVDAAFKINGIAGTSSSNTVVGALDGVTLTLLKTNVNSPTTLTVTKDSSSTLTSAINNFVKVFNDSTKSMNDLGYFDANTQKAGTLQGDSTLRIAQSQLRTLLQTRAGGSTAYQTLTDIGVSVARNAQTGAISLTFDSDKLNAAVAADYAGVATLVATVGSAFKTGLNGLVAPGGSISSATDNTNRLIKDLGRRATVLQGRLADTEARYRKQFSALDSLVASMNKTSAYLTQQLANLPGSSSN